MPNKYIVVNVNSEGFSYETAIVFPPNIIHVDMARRMNVEPHEVISAGFYRVWGNIDGDIKADVFGKSESLQKRCRMEDTDLILKSIGESE